MVVGITPTGATVEPTDFSRGVWDAGLLHGGPVVGLMAWASERQVEPEAGLICSRLTVDLVRGVPVAPLTVKAAVVKPGRRALLIEAVLTHDGDEVTRARSLWLKPGGGWDSTVGEPPARPSEAADPGGGEFDYPRPGFNCDAAELRYLRGSNEESGPAVIWARLTSPLLAGAPTSPFVAAATISDLAAAAGFERGPHGGAFINPDLTLQLNREPRGEWLALDARNHHSANGVGFNEAVVADDDGVCGRVLQSLVESPRQPIVDPNSLKI